MIGAISTALTGLTAATKKVDAAASNIANISSAGSLDPASANQPYEALTTVQSANGAGGVTATNVPKNPGYVSAFSPDSPYANQDGLVGAPNVDLAEEAVNLKLAEIAYKANISVLKVADEMSKELGRVFDETA